MMIAIIFPKIVLLIKIKLDGYKINNNNKINGIISEKKVMIFFI
jgi:hypothetical protein